MCVQLTDPPPLFLWQVMDAPQGPKQTEVLLDILETKTHTAVDVVVDAIGEVYPHIYLMLKDEDGLDGKELHWH